MPAIYPISTGRVSDALLRSRLLSQFEFDRTELVKLQDRLSTGLRLTRPSDDVPAGMRAIALQRLLEERQQTQTNLNTSQSYLAATETALSGATDLVADIRAQALAAVDSTTSETQRGVIAQEVQHAIEQLMNIGNRSFRGRFLFAGSTSTARPFEATGSHVAYRGNEVSLQSFADVGSLFDTNLTGDAAFGAISPRVRGTADLNPVLTWQTRLADLRGGLGVNKGSILVSDGSSSRTIDLSTAETLADVARRIEANPPAGRTVSVELGASGLVIDIDDAGGGNLTVREVGGGSTAEDLGILNTTGVGTGTLTGIDVNPRLLPTTRLANLLGTRAQATLVSAGAHNDLVIEAARNGPEYNGVQVQFVNNLAAGDQAFASFNSLAKTLTIDIAPGATTANTVVQAINSLGDFTARLGDESILANDGTGFVDPAAAAQTAGGSGIALDQQSGLQIVNGGQTHVIDIASAVTVEDLLNKLNSSPANVLATINSQGTGIDVRSRLSGADFQIGENGGTTATELGLRSLNLTTRLNELNYERGVETAPGTDFTILRKDGTTLDIDLTGSETIGDVLDRINLHVDNQDANRLAARLAEFGNGLELVDGNSAGTANVTVTRGSSFAAWDLGLIARGEDQAVAPATAAAALVSFAPPNDVNTAFRVTASVAGPAANGVTIEIVDSGSVSGNLAAASYNPTTARLTIDIDLGSTTASAAVAAVNAAGLPFTAALDTGSDPTNNGSGILASTGALAVTGGGSETPLRGTDVNPLETKGIFNSLLRLQEALVDFDLPQIERAVAMLDQDFNRLSFSRGDVGARERTFETLRRRLDNEEVELRATLSKEIDADIVQAISDLTARQANFEATLRLIGQTLQMSVLNFL